MLVFVENAIMSLTERRSTLLASGRSQVSSITKQFRSAHFRVPSRHIHPQWDK